MEPLQLIAVKSTEHARRRLADSLPEAPQVPYRRRQDTAVRAQLTARTWLATRLRRTADRVDPHPAPSTG
jgi:hypothetical protein